MFLLGVKMLYITEAVVSRESTQQASRRISDQGRPPTVLLGYQSRYNLFVVIGFRTFAPDAPSFMEVYVIKVTLLGTKPPVWRRILLPRKITLRNLHRTLQTVRGWTNAHLHQFVLPGTGNFGPRHGFGEKVENESRPTLGVLLDFPGAKLLYEYDFGDCWRHELVLERLLLGDESFRQMCVAGERHCPPEDSGGPHGFAELLNAFTQEDHPEHEPVREWLGDDFAPGSFEPDEINRKLRRRRG
jgi:hypothetical protein